MDSFSTVIRTASHEQHMEAETSTFMSDLLGGRLGVEAYAARVRQCAEQWPGGYIAHHYTRYLGDLSGGQIIRDRAERTWGFARKGDGVRFYVFEGIGNPAAFKRGYRELLDAVRADDLEKQRIVAECKRAFALNTAVFRALGEEFPLSA